MVVAGNVRQMRWAASAAIIGGLTAIAVTPTFAAAYFLAYPGSDPLPFWFGWAQPRLAPLRGLASYETYGRIYNVVYVLFLPLVVVLHRQHRDSSNPLERRGYIVLTVGLITTAIGVAGDYWSDGLGFMLEVPGLLLMTLGVILWGVGLVRGQVIPAIWGWLLTLCGPGAIASSALVSHAPSGPTLSFVCAWLAVGCLVLWDRNATAPMAASRRAGR